jgi:hypothetical protein
MLIRTTAVWLAWHRLRADSRRARRGPGARLAQRPTPVYDDAAGNAGRVIGCVYIYPSGSADGAAEVRSWVRADQADLDVAVHDAVSVWLSTAWPFTAISYAPRTGSRDDTSPNQAKRDLTDGETADNA